MNIGSRIQNLRKKKGISQEELADKLNVSRQAVSKWESEQSLPEIDKIVWMSDYFEVTTDYLLKGTESYNGTAKRKMDIDAQIFTVLATAINFIGLVLSIVIWIEWQTTFSIVVGAACIVGGCTLFTLGQLVAENTKKAAKLFWLINIWFLSLIPISCLFNWIQGAVSMSRWPLSPIPHLGNSLIAYGMAWLFYFVLCIVFDLSIVKKH